MPTPYPGSKYGICATCGTRSMKRFMHPERTNGVQWKCVNPGHWWRARLAGKAARKKRWRAYRKNKNK